MGAGLAIFGVLGIVTLVAAALRGGRGGTSPAALTPGQPGSTSPGIPALGVLPSCSSPDVIKEVQRTINVKADGKWGPISQAAFVASGLDWDDIVDCSGDPPFDPFGTPAEKAEAALGQAIADGINEVDTMFRNCSPKGAIAAATMSEALNASAVAIAEATSKTEITAIVANYRDLMQENCT